MYVALLLFGNSACAPTIFDGLLTMDDVQLHKLNWAWFKCSVQKPALWIAKETKTFICAKQKNAIWSPIIIHKELLTKNVHSVILWYGDLYVINIWYCWMIIGPIPSNIPIPSNVPNSFYVWQSCQYIFLESSYASCDDVLRFSVVSFADPFIPAFAFNKFLPIQSAAWVCWCVWATNLSAASNAILILHPFPLRLWVHSQYVLPLVRVLFLI